jgi:hypothetical protein
MKPFREAGALKCKTNSQVSNDHALLNFISPICRDAFCKERISRSCRCRSIDCPFVGAFALET